MISVSAMTESLADGISYVSGSALIDVVTATSK